MSGSVFRDPHVTNLDVEGPLTLRQLHHELGTLLVRGFNPDLEVLTYRDPEGNGYVTLEAVIGVAELKATDRGRVETVAVIDLDDVTPQDKELRHVLICALHNVDAW